MKPPRDWPYAGGPLVTSRGALAAAKTAKPDPDTLKGWHALHAPHGRVWKDDAAIGEWRHWHCSGCGERKSFPKDETVN